MFKSGDRIFVPGASGEPTALVQRIFGADVHVTTSFLPGVNALNAATFGDDTRVSGLFMQRPLAAAQRDGRFRHLPLSYAAMLKYLREGAPFDVCVVQVTPPDNAGRCWLGPSAEFTPEVLRRARRIVAVLNPRVPAIVNGQSIAFDRIDEAVEADTPLAGYGAGKPDPVATAIAGHIASLIGDGAAIQVGLGKIPGILMEQLHDRRRLRLHSGMFSDGVMTLAAAGALDSDWAHTTTAILGSERLYDWAASRRDIHVRGVEYTHDPARLAGLAGLVAVNSALEVDLFGQCNLEIADGSGISGAGGAPDFARGARLAPGGISVIALPATFGRDQSRISAQLGAPMMASLARTDVDVVVTEHGLADLRGLSVHERAEALIAIAAPSARAELIDRWREIAARL